MSQPEEENFKDQVSLLVDAIIEDNQERAEEEMDPFGNYVYRLRVKMQSDPMLFHSRFVKGYEALLTELKHEQSAHEIPRPKDKW